jgi:predicted acetyltransferase
MVEFRPVPESDRAELRRQLRYAFAPELGPAVPDPADEWPPNLYDQRGLYDDGTLVSSCKLYTLEAWVRGEYRALGGLGAVATPPEHRGQGYARESCRQALEAYREEGVGLVALWPVSIPLYRDMGWAVANDYYRIDLPPDALPSHDGTGEFRPLEADDWQRLRRVETAYGEGTGLSLRRSEAWWRERTLADWDGGGTPYCYGYERDGDLAGYVIYTVEDDELRTLAVQDYAHVDEDAHRAVLDFLGRHGTKIERVRLRRAADTDLLARVPDPDRVECRVKAGPMVRLSDVGFLEEIDWPDRDVAFRMAVTDTLVTPNDGQFRVRIENGSATVESLERPNDEPAVSVDVGTLSQLVVGTRGVASAQRLGGLVVRDGEIRDALAAIFRPRPVCLREFF